MEAIARIDYGLAEGEFWRITPRQFKEYGRRYAEIQRSALLPFQFLATITARCAGNADADFMNSEPEVVPGGFEAWLVAKAEAEKREHSKAQIEGPEAATAGHEIYGNLGRAEGCEAGTS